MEYYNKHITVIDSYPGAGKTSFAIQNINESSEEEKIIYITPFLTEVKRIIESCPEKHFIQPSAQSGKGRKMNHLLSLILKGENIVSTHALFSDIDDELINALRLNDYTLYLDEVFQTVEQFMFASGTRERQEQVTKQDMQSLLTKNYIAVDDEYVVSWIDNENLLSKYDQIKNLADRQSLYFVNNNLLLWSFPIEVFREGIFNHIYIMTYRFDSQVQSYYYQYYGLEYDKFCVNYYSDHYEIDPWYANHEIEWKQSIKDKIHIEDNPKLNRIGDYYYDGQNRLYQGALSVTWYDNNPEMLKKISDNLANYFKNYSEGKSNLRMWTCFKEHVKKIKSKNVSSKYWLALNARAVNDYADRTDLAYLINRYTSPFISQFFSKREIEINQDEYALTEMIQWIWRSAIRNYQDIHIYIPSQRMRTLLINFLNDDELIISSDN